MDITFELLSKAQQRISANNENGHHDRLMFCPIGELVHIEFFGDPFDESFGDFLQILCLPEVANRLNSLALRGPDEGANGTRNFDLTPLLESGVIFPELKEIFIEPTLPEHHNQTIIGSDYDEEGQIGRLVAKTPVIQSLTTPSAPDDSFFEQGLSALRHLRVDSGYDTQNFILNLSQSSGFPNLRTLDFGDYNQRYMKTYPGGDEFTNGCTPFEHYQQLFNSTAFSTFTRFILRNSILSPEQLKALHHMKKDVQFMVVQTPQGEYVP